MIVSIMVLVSLLVLFMVNSNGLSSIQSGVNALNLSSKAKVGSLYTSFGYNDLINLLHEGLVCLKTQI